MIEVGGGAVPIGTFELTLAALFVLVAAGVSLWMGLKLERSLLIASVRLYLQVLALGFVLKWVFANQSAPLVLVLLVIMTLVAARVVLQRVKHAPPGLFGSAAVSMAFTGFTVTFAVTAVVLRVPVWYEARYVLPIAGMVVGNSMTGIALAIERLFSDLDSRAGEMLATSALGASVWEMARPSVRTALTAGMVPTINSMAAAGVVFIPGMMTGQILSGGDPIVASRYQIVVMLMVAAATTLGAVMAVLLMYRARFTPEGVYIEKGYRETR